MGLRKNILGSWGERSFFSGSREQRPPPPLGRPQYIKLMFSFFRSHGSDFLTVLGAVQGSSGLRSMVLTSRMGSLEMFSSVLIFISVASSTADN